MTSIRCHWVGPEGVICNLRDLTDVHDPQTIGKLKKSHIQRGYVVLKKIEKALGRKPLNTTKLLDLTNEFYSLIPCALLSR